MTRAKTSRYDGQWLGRLTTEDGAAWIALELEHIVGADRLAGLAYLYPDDHAIASGAVEIRMDVGATHFEDARLPVQGVDPRDGSLFPTSDVEQYFPNSGLAEFADVAFDLHPDGTATVKLDTEYLSGTTTLVNGQADPKSKLKAKRISWDRFRAEMFKDGRSQFIYRGQAKPDKLRTTFHRTSRKTLHMYRTYAIPEVYKALSGQHSLSFNMADADDQGAFYSLLQHHGYPTPLLDWTESPFVAAYFAFASIPREAKNGHVRIFTFDRRWTADVLQSFTVAFARPHFSIMKVLNTGNPRAIPQQAIAALTNVDDIEAFFAMVEEITGTAYLHAYDIPVSDRKAAMDDLVIMGIQPGALMPGLDGSCRALRYRHFGD